MATCRRHTTYQPGVARTGAAVVRYATGCELMVVVASTVPVSATTMATNTRTEVPRRVAVASVRSPAAASPVRSAIVLSTSYDSMNSNARRVAIHTGGLSRPTAAAPYSNGELAHAATVTLPSRTVFFNH